MINEYTAYVKKHGHYPGAHRRFDGVHYLSNALAGEAGEVANVVKKEWRDGIPDGLQHFSDTLKGELGDVLWYLTAMCDEFGFTLADVMQYNMEKLDKQRGTK